MKIKNLETKSDIFLAPMAGVTDIGFRQLCCHFGAGLTYTEMVSVKALYQNSKRTISMLRTFEGESPVAVQLFGHEPEIFHEVIKSGLLDKFDIIDINMGCPAPKIVKNGDGSSLLKNIDLARQIIEACVSATDKPITVKFRKGFKDSDNVAVEFAKMCEGAGASAITIHGRTREQMYSGKVDLQTIKAVAEAVNIPVVGNGDIVDECTYEQMLKTGVDAVMIGRGSFGCPEIFARLQGNAVDMTKMQMIEKHYEILSQVIQQKYLVKLFRKHLLWYLSGYKNCTELKKQIVLLTDVEEIFSLLREFFKDKE